MNCSFRQRLGRVEVLTAVKRVLVVCGWVVCDLHSTPPFVRIFKEIHIRTLIESMVSRFNLG